MKKLLLLLSIVIASCAPASPNNYNKLWKPEPVVMSLKAEKCYASTRCLMRPFTSEGQREDCFKYLVFCYPHLKQWTDEVVLQQCLIGKNMYDEAIDCK